MPTPLETFARVLHQTGLFSLSLAFSLWFADILQVDIWNSMTVQGSQKVGGDRSPAATYFLLGGMSTCYLSKYLWWAYGKVFTELHYNELNCCFCQKKQAEKFYIETIFPFLYRMKAWAIPNCKWVFLHENPQLCIDIGVSDVKVSQEWSWNLTWIKCTWYHRYHSRQSHLQNLNSIRLKSVPQVFWL